MPRLIEPDDNGSTIDLDALVDWCESPAFDPSCEDGLAAAAPMLAALARNRHFLADAAMAELKTRCAGQRHHNPYSAQVMLLRPPAGKYVLRAAFWPAMDDHVVRASGTAPFLYHVPHDHGFDFLTVGYLGPGYGSDYHDYDAAGVTGFEGEAVRLRWAGRSWLHEGRMLLYRAHRDIHSQLPPERMSISLNILASPPGQGWRRQYRFDTARGMIAQSMTVASAQLLLELTVGCGDDNAMDLAEAFARQHPHDAMRLTAWNAMGDVLEGRARLDHLEGGARSDSPLVRARARSMVKNLQNG
ncbi:transposase [Sphingobium abikonense]|uniref:transposase n=1 Tax=Sphingobium abikonense TaxID=86193 RepID=UPI003519AE09